MHFEVSGRPYWWMAIDCMWLDVSVVRLVDMTIDKCTRQSLIWKKVTLDMADSLHGLSLFPASKVCVCPCRDACMRHDYMAILSMKGGNTSSIIVDRGGPQDPACNHILLFVHEHTCIHVAHNQGGRR